jgi:hypothetical protein
MVVQACHLSYSECEDQKDYSSKAAQKKVNETPSLKKKKIGVVYAQKPRCAGGMG